MTSECVRDGGLNVLGLVDGAALKMVGALIRE